MDLRAFVAFLSKAVESIVSRASIFQIAIVPYSFPGPSIEDRIRFRCWAGIGRIGGRDTGHHSPPIGSISRIASISII